MTTEPEADEDERLVARVHRWRGGVWALIVLVVLSLAAFIIFMVQRSGFQKCQHAREEAAAAWEGLAVHAKQHLARAEEEARQTADRGDSSWTAAQTSIGIWREIGGNASRAAEAAGASVSWARSEANLMPMTTADPETKKLFDNAMETAEKSWAACADADP